MPTGQYGKFSIYSQVPSHPKGRVLVVPGFAESLQQTKPIVNSLAANNLAAYTYTQPRLSGKQDGASLHPLERQGKVVLMALDKLIPGQGKVTAVAHSLGTAAVLKAAQINPKKLDSLILMQPVGLAGRLSFRDLFLKGVRKNRNNYRLASKASLPHNLKSVAKAQLGSIATIAKHPRLAMQEAKAVGDYAIMEDIKRVVESGVEVHLVISKHDEYFDYTKMQAQLKDLANVATSITTLDEPHHGHDINWLDPALTASLVTKLLA